MQFNNYKTGDIVWACAFKRCSDNSAFEFYSEPTKGVLTYDGCEALEKTHQHENATKTPRYFVPFKKNAKGCDFDDLAWSKAVSRVARHYANTEQECIALYNKLIDDNNQLLQSIIDENNQHKI